MSALREAHRKRVQSYLNQNPSARATCNHVGGSKDDLDTQTILAYMKQVAADKRYEQQRRQQMTTNSLRGGDGYLALTSEPAPRAGTPAPADLGQMLQRQAELTDSLPHGLSLNQTLSTNCLGRVKNQDDDLAENDDDGDEDSTANDRRYNARRSARQLGQTAGQAVTMPTVIHGGTFNAAPFDADDGPLSTVTLNYRTGQILVNGYPIDNGGQGLKGPAVGYPAKSVFSSDAVGREDEWDDIVPEASEDERGDQGDFTRRENYTRIHGAWSAGDRGVPPSDASTPASGTGAGLFGMGQDNFSEAEYQAAVQRGKAMALRNARGDDEPLQSLTINHVTGEIDYR
jgi:hypothetical protein